MALPFRFGTGTVLNNQFAQQVDADFQALNTGGAVQPSGDMTGATDATAINAALAAAVSSGVPTVPLGSGNFYINSSIILNKSNLRLVGSGSLSNNGTIINSLVNGPALLVQQTGNQPETWLISDMQIQTPTSGSSATGITIDSSSSGTIRNLSVQVNGPNQVGFKSAPGQGAGLTSSQGFYEGLFVILVSSATSATGVYLTAINYGVTGADTTGNLFLNTTVLVAHATQTGVHLGLCDANIFHNLNVFGPVAPIAATTINFDYSDQSSANTILPCANTFYYADLGFGISGTSVINTGSPGNSPAPNSFMGWSFNDSAVQPSTLFNVEFIGQGTILVGRKGQIGYKSGAGGSVTQLTSITTAVTLNSICGQITTVSNAFTSGTVVQFAVNCNLIAATDTVVISSETPNMILAVNGVTTNQFTIAIDPLATLTTTVVANFAIIKAITS